jgi:hypothetical protein
MKGLSVALILAACVGLAGCAHDDDDSPRSVVQVYSINNNLPLQSDLYNLGPDKEPEAVEDNFIPIDYVPVQFISRPHDPALTMDPNRPFGTVRFTEYSIDFEDNDLDDDGVDDVRDVRYPMNVVVPIGGIANTAILAVPAGWKSEGALFMALITGAEYITTAHITFYGEEETSGDAIVVDAGLVVGFSDYGDAN